MTRGLWLVAGGHAAPDDRGDPDHRPADNKPRPKVAMATMNEAGNDRRPQHDHRAGDRGIQHPERPEEERQDEGEPDRFRGGGSTRRSCWRRGGGWSDSRALVAGRVPGDRRAVLGPRQCRPTSAEPAVPADLGTSPARWPAGSAASRAWAGRQPRTRWCPPSSVGGGDRWQRVLRAVTGGASVVVQSVGRPGRRGQPVKAGRPSAKASGRVCEVHCDPFHQRSPMDSGSRYQPA